MAKSAPLARKVKTQAIVFFAGDTSAVLRDMRTGTPSTVVPEVAELLGISQERLLESLKLPKSTLKGRVSKGQVLAAIEQDRLYRANRLFNRAFEVLEDEDAARSWIMRPNRALGGEAPLTLLDTEPGYELVLDTLGRIEYGVIS